MDNSQGKLMAVLLKLFICWLATVATYSVIVKIGILADYGEFQPFIPISGLAARRWDVFPIALHSAVICVFSVMTPLALAGHLALERESTSIDDRQPKHLYLHYLKHTFIFACVFNVIILSTLPMLVGLEIKYWLQSDYRLTYKDLLYPIYSGAGVCSLLLWLMFFKNYHVALDKQQK